MSEAAKAPEEAQATDGKKEPGRRMSWLLGLALALPAAAGGFYLMQNEPWRSLDDGRDQVRAAPTADERFAYLPMEPIVINLGARGEARLLRFGAQLEVAPRYADDVRHLMPRIIDVLNIYLRALEMHEIEEPAALLRLRAQMLRRVQIVTGAGRVNDLLITEFILN